MQLQDEEMEEEKRWVDTVLRVNSIVGLLVIRKHYAASRQVERTF